MIAIEDIAHARYAAPDLDAMERFLLDFGMRTSARTDAAVYMRGFGTAHHVHVTELGDAGALGFGLRARSADDLAQLAAELGVRVEDRPEPGGGQRVRVKDPGGFIVEVIHGQQRLEPIAHREPIAANPIINRRRHGPVIRLSPVCLRTRSLRSYIAAWARPGPTITRLALLPLRTAAIGSITRRSK